MTNETITQRILKADDGMFLTNGQTFAKTVILPVHADETVWTEITEAEKEQLEASLGGE